MEVWDLDEVKDIGEYDESNEPHEIWEDIGHHFLNVIYDTRRDTFTRDAPQNIYSRMCKQTRSFEDLPKRDSSKELGYYFHALGMLSAEQIREIILALRVPEDLL